VYFIDEKYLRVKFCVKFSMKSLMKCLLFFYFLHSINNHQFYFFLSLFMSKITDKINFVSFFVAIYQFFGSEY